MKPIVMTDHAIERLDSRRIPLSLVLEVLEFGRKAHVRGAVCYAVGAKEVRHMSNLGVDLKQAEGVQVVCSPTDGAVITAYRNRDLRGMKVGGSRGGHRSMVACWRPLRKAA